MRLLHISQSLGIGGAERQLSYLAPALSLLGHEVHIAFLDGGPNARRLKDSNVTLHHLGGGDIDIARGPGLHNYDPRLFFWLHHLIRVIRPDVVQTWIQQVDIVGGLASAAANLVWLLREPSSGTPHRSVKGIARRLIASTAACIVCNSRGGAQYWETAAPTKPAVVIPNGIPVDEINECEPNRTSFRQPRGNRCLYIGRFHECKNVVKLVQAAINIAALDPAFEAHFFGRGSALRSVQHLIAESGLTTRLTAPGETGHPWNLMKAADVFASISLYEGCPNAVMEAMACGCPLVVSDIPSHRELIPYDSAVFVDPNDVADIVRGIRHVLLDPESARLRAVRAKGLIDTFSVRTMARHYEALYLRLVARSPANTKQTDAAFQHN